jgi:hypothetical protein
MNQIAIPKPLEEERRANAWKAGIPIGTLIALWGKQFRVAREQRFRDALVLQYVGPAKRAKGRNG